MDDTLEKKSAVQQVADVAALLNGQVMGDTGVAIYNAADVREARSGDVVFAESAKFLQAALHSQASAIITRPDLVPPGESVSKPLVLVPDPRAAFVRLLAALTQAWQLPAGIHPSAVIAEGVMLGADVRIGPHVSLEAGVEVGDRVTLMAGVRVGQDCKIGADTILYPNVVLYPRVVVGRRCLLHAGCVLGGDGFGYIQVGQGLVKVPHLGGVEVGDEVEIGANTCIDRAKTGFTVIGSGTKLDNLIHIAHNVRVGMSSLLIAQTGVAGSVTIGNGVILAGQAGIADHLNIGDGARVGAQGGVIGDVARGETVSGYPARPHARKMREYAALAALPEYVKRIRSLEKRLAELEARSEGSA